MELLQGQFLPSDRVEAAWGQNRIIKVANPAAGAGFSVRVPGGSAWRIATARFILKASAQVASRVAALNIVAGDGTVLATLNGVGATTAGLTTIESFARDSPATGVIAATLEAIGLPNLVLEEGWMIESNVVALQAEDQLEGIVLWVEEFETMFDHTIDKARDELHKVERLERTLTHG